MPIFHKAGNNCVHFVKFSTYVLITLQCYLEVYIFAMVLKYAQIKTYQ